MEDLKDKLQYEIYKQIAVVCDIELENKIHDLIEKEIDKTIKKLQKNG